jgi:hypothetical protein
MCRCNCDDRGAVVTPPEPPFTAEQVEEALSKGTSVHAYYMGGQYTTNYGDEDGTVEWNDVHYSDVGTEINTPLGTVKIVQTEGGSEGDGEHAHLVIQVERSGQFFRKDGYYQSYDGLYLDGELREVHETTKTVKVYE